MVRHASGFLGVALCLLFWPSSVAAQSGISGLVTDSSGAVLPGVTVEAASPELIEKTKTVVTDAQGRYSIIDLRPGLYSVTFSLTGFNTVKRDQINLPADFTANVSVQLQVGALQETVTVSGQSPVVDTSQVARTQVLTRDVLDTLPTSRTSQGIGLIIPGIRTNNPDVGGSQAMENVRMSAHGASQFHTTVQVDGMVVNSISDVGVQAYHNDAMSQEFSYQTSAVSAEVSWGGIRLNMIPRQGGNRFSSVMYGGGTASSWQGDNVSDELIARGLAAGNSIEHIYDFNGSFGGPIKRDRIWFYSSFRKNSVNEVVANNFYADGRQGVEDQFIVNGTTRLTAQLSGANKLTVYYDRAWKYKGHDMGAFVEPETAAGKRPWKHAIYYIGQAKYTSTITNRTLFEAGYSSNLENRLITYQDGVLKTRGTPEWYANASRFDIVRGTTKTARVTGSAFTFETRYGVSASISHYTGTHNFKTGIQWTFGTTGTDTNGNADLNQRYTDGKPEEVDVRNWPLISREHVNADIGVYVQDSWTVRRFTINPGVRFEHLNTEIPEQGTIAGRFVPARHFDARQNVPNWNDVAPRLGVVYDLFGDGKTAIKAGFNKYMHPVTTSFAKRYNPMQSSTDRRDWDDCAYLPGTVTCDPAKIGAPGYHDDIAQDNELGPPSNVNFGKTASRNPASDIKRPFNLEYSVSIQRQIVQGTSVFAGWFKRTFYNLDKQDNLLVAFSDYTAFQTENPLRPGEMITIFNLNRSKLGQVDNLDVNSDTNRQFYNGFEVSFLSRLPRGAVIFGGGTWERMRERLCDQDDPNLLRFCDQTGKLFQEYGKVEGIPFKPEFKLAGSHPLPKGLEASVSFISFPGLARSVTWAVPASRFPNGQRTQAVTVGNSPAGMLTTAGGLIPPGTKFNDRWNQLDVGLKKTFRFGKWNMEGSAMLFNALNFSPILSFNNAFGSALDTPLSNLQPRLLRLAFRTTF